MKKIIILLGVMFSILFGQIESIKGGVGIVLGILDTHDNVYVEVKDVIVGGPAEKAGIKKGDIILSYNNRRMKDEWFRNKEGAWLYGNIGTTLTLQTAEMNSYPRPTLNIKTYELKRGIDIVDKMLLPVNWLLSNTDNIKKLDKEKYDIIKPELDRMVSDYKKRVLPDFHTKKAYKTYATSGPKYNVPLYNAYVEAGYFPKDAEMMATSYDTKSVLESINRTKDYEKTLIKTNVEWTEIINYLGGYSELRKTGITKEKKSVFDIESKLLSIELISPNECIAHVKIIGDEKYGLKYHKIPKTEFNYVGTYTIDDIDFADIYNIVKTKKSLSSVEGLIPNVHFSFDKKTYMPKQVISIPLNQMDETFISLAAPYHMTMKQMVNDIVPYEYYVEMDHIQEKLKEQTEIKRKAEQEKQMACDKIFKAYKEQYLKILEYHIAYRISEINNDSENFVVRKHWKVLKKLLKKYEKKHKRSPIIRKINIKANTLTKKSNSYNIVPGEDIIGANVYSKDFLKILIDDPKLGFAYSDISSLLSKQEAIKGAKNFVQNETRLRHNQEIDNKKHMEMLGVVYPAEILELQNNMVHKQELVEYYYDLHTLNSMILALPYRQLQEFFKNYGWYQGMELPNDPRDYYSSDVEFVKNFRACLKDD